MNISERLKKYKEVFVENEKDIFLAVIIILLAFLSFGLGRLSVVFENREPIKIENATNISSFSTEADKFSEISAVESQESESIGISSQEKIFVASKNGTKYYFPWCKGAQKIKEENKVLFKSAEEAKSRGFEPAKNCKGLK